MLQLDYSYYKGFYVQKLLSDAEFSKFIDTNNIVQGFLLRTIHRECLSASIIIDCKKPATAIT